jgi:DNA invertase Pin-like site-specific DNA recombinase
VRIATYARTSAADLGRVTVEQILAGLADHAARRGWEVVLGCADQGPWLEGRREGLQRLVAAVRANAVQGILIHSLGQLARSLRHLTELGQLFDRHGVALVAVEDHLDTTDPGGLIRWRDWLDLSVRLNRHVRSEGARLARLRAPGEPWGHPVAAVSPKELLTCWEGRRGRRPLSLRAIAGRFGVSEATIRKRLRELRAAGKVDDHARARTLAARGGLRKGGRPPSPLDDATLAAEWAAQHQAARQRGRQPSLAAVARHLHISRRRVRVRLQELGLLPQSPGSAG